MYYDTPPVLSSPSTIQPAHLSAVVSPVDFVFPVIITGISQYVKLWIRQKGTETFVEYKIEHSDKTTIELKAGKVFEWKWQFWTFFGNDIPLSTVSSVYQFTTSIDDKTVGDLGNPNPIDPILREVKTIFKTITDNKPLLFVIVGAVVLYFVMEN